MGTMDLHPCLNKNSVNSEPSQPTEAEEPEEQQIGIPEKQQIGIPEELLFPLEKIPDGNPIIDEIKKGQEERSLAILYYKHDQPTHASISL